MQVHTSDPVASTTLGTVQTCDGGTYGVSNHVEGLITYVFQCVYGWFYVSVFLMFSAVDVSAHFLFHLIAHLTVCSCLAFRNITGTCFGL